MGLFNHGLHYQLISYGYHGENKSESNWCEPACAEEDVCEKQHRRAGLPTALSHAGGAVQLDRAEGLFSEPQQRLQTIKD